MENKNLEQKLIDAKNLILRGLTAGLAIVTMYACGDDTCESDADCKNGYECEQTCTKVHDPCGGGEYDSCKYTCEKVDSDKNGLTNDYSLEVRESEEMNGRCDW